MSYMVSPIRRYKCVLLGFTLLLNCSIFLLAIQKRSTDTKQKKERRKTKGYPVPTYPVAALTVTVVAIVVVSVV